MADKRLVTFQDTIGQELAWAGRALSMYGGLAPRHEGEWRAGVQGSAHRGVSWSYAYRSLGREREEAQMGTRAKTT